MTPFDDALRAALADPAREPISRAEAARRAGYDRPNFHRIAHLASPKWSTAWRIIVLLGLDLSRFFPDELVLASAERIRARKKDPGRVAPGPPTSAGRGPSGRDHHPARGPRSQA